MMKQYDFDPNIKATICQNIKKYRNEKGIRLMDLAEAMGIFPKEEYGARIESPTDRNNISLMLLYKISKVLDVRIDKFFEE